MTHGHTFSFDYRYDFFVTCLKSVGEVEDDRMVLASIAHRMSGADKKDFQKFISGDKKKKKTG